MDAQLKMGLYSGACYAKVSTDHSFRQDAAGCILRREMSYILLKQQKED